MQGTKEKFSAALSWMIGNKKITQKELANNCGMSPSSVTDYKTGRREGDEDTRKKIAKYLGCDYQDFLSLGQWILDGNKPEEWTPPAKGHLAPPLKYLEPQGITKNITGKRPLSEILSSLPASQKYQEAKDVLVAGIGIPELEADKLLMKHMGLPPDLTCSLPEEKLERFAHIWEYACVKNQGLKKTAYPADKESLLERYLKGELDDVALYLRAIDWLDELFGDGGEPK